MTDVPAQPIAAPILTPCIGVCELDAHDVCIGCGRSLTLIATWSDLDDAARERIMARLDADEGAP